MRQTTLEAAIAADCDDPEPYLVYADWLQERGDPRGTSIILHDALRRDPRNREAASAAAALLEDQRGALLGDLAQRNDVELAWYQGFVSAIRFRYHAWHQLRDALRAMLASPACAFVQRITIDSAEQADRVVELLIAHGEPRTLCHVAIGRPSEWSLPPALVAAFPRLDRGPAVEWEQALAKARAQRRLSPAIDVDALPPLVMRAEMTWSDARTIVVGLRAEIELGRPIGMLRALPRACTRDSLDQFALALATHDVKWAFDAIGSLGGDRCALYLGDQFRVLPHARAVQALEHLQKIGGDIAASELVRLGRFTGGLSAPRARAAADALEMFALTREVDSMAQLIARTCPRGRAGERYLDIQRRWLEDMMVGGDRLTAEDFELHVAAHPIRRALVGALVWTTDDATFRVSADGTLRDVDDAPFALAPDAKVGVAHPIELTDEQRSAWRIDAQPFPQLQRPIYRLTEEERSSIQLRRFDLERVSYEQLVRGLLVRGWFDTGGSLGRRFRRDNAFAKLSEGVRIHRGRDWIDRPLGEFHPVTISELMRDLDEATAVPRRSRRAS